jgi:hypothetical protein
MSRSVRPVDWSNVLSDGYISYIFDPQLGETYLAYLFRQKRSSIRLGAVQS